MTDEVFIETWNSCNTIEEVCERLSITREELIATSGRIRKERGDILKRTLTSAALEKLNHSYKYRTRKLCACGCGVETLRKWALGCSKTGFRVGPGRPNR